MHKSGRNSEQNYLVGEVLAVVAWKKQILLQLLPVFKPILL